MADDKIWNAVNAGDDAELKSLASETCVSGGEVLLLKKLVPKEALLFKKEYSVESPAGGLMQCGMTPLQIACAKGKTETATFLLSMGFADDQLLECAHFAGGGASNKKIAVMFAAMADHAETVKAVLAAFVVEEQLLANDLFDKRTALNYAAMNSAETVKAVVEGGHLVEQLSAVDGDGKTALMMAASANWILAPKASVSVLLEAARSTFEGDAFKEHVLKGCAKGSTALMHAAMSGKNNLVAAMLEGGHVAEQISAKDKLGMTALMHAATCSGTSQTIEAVLEAGSVEQQVLAVDDNHMNALMHVAKQGRKASVEVLLCAGFAAEQLAGDQKTALDFAKSTYRNDIIKAIGQAVAAVEWSEKHGEDVSTCVKEAFANPDAFTAKISAESA